jgi:hypothetical protein
LSGASRFEEALARFREGDVPGAQSAIGDFLAAFPSDARALHLGGEIALRAGDLGLARARLATAAAAGTPGPELLSSLARVHWRLGEFPVAAHSAARALSMRPRFPPAAIVAAFCAQVQGDRAGFLQHAASLGLPDAATPVVDLAFQALAEAAGDGKQLFPPPDAAAAPALSLTVVVSSIDEAKLARCRRALETSLPPGFEFIAIRDARSLAEAYNRALAAARGEATVFLHDDVEVLSPDAGAILSRALARADVIGVAGTRRLAGPTLGWAGQQSLAGWLVHGSSAGPAWDFSALGLHGGLVGGMQALDGCFLAARTHAARDIGFDAATFDAFHFYDLDFCLRANRAGLRVAVATDLLIAHASRGSLGAAWDAQAARFLAKFAPLGRDAAQPNHFYASRCASREAALRLHDELNGFCAALGAREG